MTLVSLGFGSPPPPSDAPEALRLLLDCHVRIRRFAAMAVRLARTLDAPAGQRADAAAQLQRYFRIALPLHVADEEESLAPRLRALQGDERERLGPALREMSRQHVDIEARLARVLPAWQQVEESGGVHAGPSEGEALALCDLLLRHLALEETELFPLLARSVPAAEGEAFVQELRARRRTALG